MNPFTLFLITVAALAALLVVLCLSIWYYWRAKDLAPFLSKLKSVKEEIALAQDSAARDRPRGASLMHFPAQRHPATALAACRFCHTVCDWAYIRDLQERDTYQGQKLTSNKSQEDA